MHSLLVYCLLVVYCIIPQLSKDGPYTVQLPGGKGLLGCVMRASVSIVSNVALYCVDLTTFHCAYKKNIDKYIENYTRYM